MTIPRTEIFLKSTFPAYFHLQCTFNSLTELLIVVCIKSTNLCNFQQKKIMVLQIEHPVYFQQRYIYSSSLLCLFTNCWMICNESYKHKHKQRSSRQVHCRNVLTCTASLFLKVMYWLPLTDKRNVVTLLSNERKTGAVVMISNFNGKTI